MLSLAAGAIGLFFFALTTRVERPISPLQKTLLVIALFGMATSLMLGVRGWKAENVLTRCRRGDCLHAAQAVRVVRASITAMLAMILAGTSFSCARNVRFAPQFRLQHRVQSYGPLAPEVAACAIARRPLTLLQCYFESDNAVGWAGVRAELLLASDGRVVHAAMTTRRSFGQQAIDACLEKAFRAFQFPRTKDVGFTWLIFSFEIEPAQRSVQNGWQRRA